MQIENKIQPAIKLDPFEVFIKAKKLKKKNKDLAKIFKRTEGRISQAFDGHAPGLLGRIDSYLTKLENRNVKEAKAA